MRAPIIALLILGVVAPASAQSADADRAYALAGTWTCRSALHSAGTSTYVRNADGSIAMTNRFRTARGAAGEFHDVYRYDPQTAEWTWTSRDPAQPAVRQAGTAGAWTGDAWVFTGTIKGLALPPSGSIRQPVALDCDVRMTYTRIDDATFVRTFEQGTGNRWITTSTATCTRATR